MKVICPYCGKNAKLVNGDAIYPHRKDLYQLKFWQCKPCDAYVGCHKQTKQCSPAGTTPLGRLANVELRKAKILAHASFDWIWRDGHKKRGEAYKFLASELNIVASDCHIGMFDVDLCKRVVEIGNSYRDNLPTKISHN